MIKKKQQVVWGWIDDPPSVRPWECIARRTLMSGCIKQIRIVFKPILDTIACVMKGNNNTRDTHTRAATYELSSTTHSRYNQQSLSCVGNAISTTTCPIPSNCSQVCLDFCLSNSNPHYGGIWLLLLIIVDAHVLDLRVNTKLRRLLVFLSTNFIISKIVYKYIKFYLLTEDAISKFRTL